MHSEIRTVRDPELRVQIVEQRSTFDKNPSECLEQYQDQQQEFRERIVKAQGLLGQTNLNYELRVKISQVCGELDVDGLRGDIVTNRAARAYAAYMGRTEVTVQDVQAIIKMCLRHRLRKDPLESIDSGDKVQTVFEEIFDELLN
jgi:magnesium chelatase subunit I